jgi:hypothetical protein
VVIFWAFGVGNDDITAFNSIGSLVDDDKHVDAVIVDTIIIIIIIIIMIPLSLAILIIPPITLIVIVMRS